MSAILGGVAIAFAFPPFEAYPAAWIAIPLIFYSCVNKTGWHAFRNGFIAGLTSWLLILYWLLYMPVNKALAALAWVSLSFVLALFIGSWSWFTCYWIPNRFFAGLQFGAECLTATLCRPEPTEKPTASVANPLQTLTWPRLIWPLVGGAAWCSLELIRTHLFWGFPWTPLGSSQYKILPLIQIAAVTGCYGVSFLIAWVSLSITLAITHVTSKSTNKGRPVLEVLFPISVLAVILAIGTIKILHSKHIQTTELALKIALIQPSIPQQVIWDPDQITVRQSQLIELTLDSLRGAPSVIIWPEASVPEFSDAFLATVFQICSSNRVVLIFGADYVPTDSDLNKPHVYNAAFVLSPKGSIEAIYQKQRLVPFGEFIPFEKVFPLMRKLSPIPSSYTPGTRPAKFPLPNGFSASPLICFEDTFPHLARKAAKLDVDFLLNLTNDGWFGETAAQKQHMITALFRAVENGLPLIRCANNGVTCHISRLGSIEAMLCGESGSVHRAGVLHITIFKDKTPKVTFYRQWGDVFAIGCLLITAFALGWPLLKNHYKHSTSIG